MNIDRLDWNLFSIVIIVINVWLNFVDRLMCEIRCMMLIFIRRISVVIVCIMINVLEVEGIKFLNKVIYLVKYYYFYLEFV